MQRTTNSHPTRHDKLSKEQNRQKYKFTREASKFTSLLAMASKFTSLLAMASEVTREASKVV